MGREISFFADYHQHENRITNYCGLLMKMLYQHSPGKFEELLATLLKKDTNIIIGPTFSQQTRGINNIPDLVIAQSSFSIHFEVKKTNWFYDDQIDRYIDGFDKNIETKILFLLSNFDNDKLNLEEEFRIQIEKAKKYNVILQPITFEDFVDSLEQVFNTGYLSELLEEFKIYLDRSDLLPKWKYLLDVVNCSGTMAEIDQGVYICPNTGGSYSHRRAKYFGAYGLKKVVDIFEIKAIVVVAENLGETSIKWKNDSEANDIELFNEAKLKLQTWQWRIDENRTTPLQVFILDKREKTNFIKETKGGMQQSKKYFWDIAVGCKNSLELAEKLYDRTWGDI